VSPSPRQERVEIVVAVGARASNRSDNVPLRTGEASSAAALATGPVGLDFCYKLITFDSVCNPWPIGEAFSRH